MPIDPTVPQKLDALPPTRQLDEVLKCLMSKEPPNKTALEIVDKLIEQGISTKESDVIEILQKLVKDGFTKFEHRSVTYNKVVNGNLHSTRRDETHYFATFEGRALIQNEGGFQGRLKLQNEYEDRIEKLESEQQRIQKKTFVLTWAAGLIGFGVFVIALLEYLLSVKSHYPQFPCWSCL